MISNGDIQRCAWAGNDPLMQTYHDQEWGVPEYDSRALWEMLMLEGFQAGLSWRTILHKRAAFRQAFHGFDPHVVARFGANDIERLMVDPGIVRARNKIEATIGGARAYLALEAEGQDFSRFVWGLVGGVPMRHSWQQLSELPAQTPLSVMVSRALKQRGFKFVGPVIVYSWMQAVGMVNDHIVNCFRYDSCDIHPPER